MTHPISDGESTVASTPRRQKWTLGVAGLTCAGDAAGLARRLRRIEGVEEVTVNPLTELAYVAYDPDLFDPTALVAAIEAAGYRAR